MDIIHQLKIKDHQEDPFLLLGVTPQSSDEELLGAFENKKALSRGNQNMIKRLEEAYGKIKHQEDRIKAYLLGPTMPKDLYELEKEAPQKLQYLGPGRWIKLIENIKSSL